MGQRSTRIVFDNYFINCLEGQACNYRVVETNFMSDEAQGKLIKEAKADPDRYRMCSEPFADSDEADAAIRAFVDEIEAARVKHRIADLSYVIQDSMKTDSGEPGMFIITGHQGDSLKREAMLAYALGQCQKEREHLIAELMAGRGYKKRK